MRPAWSILPDEWKQVLQQHDVRPFRAEQILQALYRDYISSWDEATTLPKELREKLKTDFPFTDTAILNVTQSSDGTRKLLVGFGHLLRLAEHAADGLEEQLHVQHEGLVQRILHPQAVLFRQDVLLVVLHRVLRADDLILRDIHDGGPVGDAGAHPHDALLLLGVCIGVEQQLRARANEGHLALEDILGIGILLNIEPLTLCILHKVALITLGFFKVKFRRLVSYNSELASAVVNRLKVIGNKASLVKDGVFFIRLFFVFAV